MTGTGRGRRRTSCPLLMDGRAKPLLWVCRRNLSSTLRESQLGEAVLRHLGFDTSAVAGILVPYEHTYRCTFSLQIYHDQNYFDMEDNSM